MTEKEFLSKAKGVYGQINELKSEPNLQDYEIGLRKIMNELARSVVEGQLGGSTKDRRKKK